MIKIYKRLCSSLRIKYLSVIFFTIILTCVASFAFMHIITKRVASDMESQEVVAMWKAVASTSEISGISMEEIILDFEQAAGRRIFYRTLSEIPAKFDVNEQDMVPRQFYMGKLKFFTAGVIKVDGGYLYFPTTFPERLGKQVFFNTLIFLAFLNSIAFVAITHRAIRPIKKLDAAIKKLAGGDFSVSVDHKSRDEMGKVVQNFNWMTAQLKNMEYFRKDFVSNVSHELKTPIATIQGSVKLLTSIPFENLTETKFQKYTTLIKDETTHMSGLVSDLLRLSYLENQNIADHRSKFSLDEQIRRSILALESQWKKKQIHLDIQLDQVSYDGDEELLQQVWYNLLSNAIKFTQAQGIVIIKLRRFNEEISVSIADNGMGMPPEVLERVFEKFYQGERAHNHEGSGLGLSIVKRIVELHRGRIQMSSIEDGGTTCTVYLPLGEANE